MLNSGHTSLKYFYENLNTIDKKNILKLESGEDKISKFYPYFDKNLGHIYICLQKYFTLFGGTN